MSTPVKCPVQFRLSNTYSPPQQCHTQYSRLTSLVHRLSLQDLAQYEPELCHKLRNMVSLSSLHSITYTRSSFLTETLYHSEDSLRTRFTTKNVSPADMDLMTIPLVAHTHAIAEANKRKRKCWCIPNPKSQIHNQSSLSQHRPEIFPGQPALEVCR